MRVLITGGGGQLAADLIQAFEPDEVTAPTHAELDITSVSDVARELERVQPDVVVNTAAFHRVDQCESEPEQSFLVNAAAPQRLAVACRERGALLVHISTDYVFDGQKGMPYVEDDPINPLSTYAASKAAGEMSVRCTTGRHLIVRTTGLYGLRGMTSRHGNFVETMLRLAGSGQPVSVVGDQVLTPSYTVDVAESIVRLVRLEATGTYHVTNSGGCSWYDFAAAVFELAGLAVDLRYTTQADRPMPARRPPYSVLAHRALLAAGLPEPRTWRDALTVYMLSRRSAAVPGRA